MNFLKGIVCSWNEGPNVSKVRFNAYPLYTEYKLAGNKGQLYKV